MIGLNLMYLMWHIKRTLNLQENLMIDFTVAYAINIELFPNIQKHSNFERTSLTLSDLFPWDWNKTISYH